MKRGQQFRRTPDAKRIQILKRELAKLEPPMKPDASTEKAKSLLWRIVGPTTDSDMLSAIAEAKELLGL